MRTVRVSFVLAALLPCLSGCVGVSMHSTRPVEVRVTDRATGKLIPDAKISVSYSYHSYGVFYLFRLPRPAIAQTDTNGVAIMPLATFNSDIYFHAAGTVFLVTPELIRKGGFPSGSYWSGGGESKEPLVEHPPPVVVQLTPTK